MASQLKQIPNRSLGQGGPVVSSIGLGTMGIGAFYGKTDEDEAFKALTYAADRGMTFWDCSDIYGNTESTLGNWFNATGRRADIFLATKFGARKLPVDAAWTGGPCSTPSYIRTAVKHSLSELQTSYIDLYYQHGVDPDVPIEIVMETLREFIESGEIKYIGLSEPNVDTLKRARRVPGVGDKLIAVQAEFGPFSLDIEKNGLLDAAQELGIAIVAYSPLSRGLVTGRYRSRADLEEGDLRLILPRFSEENFPKNVILADQFQVIGKKYNATAGQVALAWILAFHPGIIPIPGCRSVSRVEENASAAELQLSPADVEEVRKLCEEADVAGGRYPEGWTWTGACIPLEEWKGE